MNKERFFVANGLALVSHSLVQGLDLIKVRQQVLQEGKTFHGLGFQRGDNPMKIFNEISMQGGGMKKFYTSYEGFAARTILYTTARTSCFLYFYDWIQKDPRRYAKPEKLLYAAIPAGLVAGVISNPIELTFTRMQVDEFYKRNYKSFYDGLLKVTSEGALFRGAICNGLRISMLMGTMTGLNDWMKENAYYTLGPSNINRMLGTVFAAAVGTIASMPFDALRIRLYTMKALPNGVMPYKHGLDAFSKILSYESNTKHSGSLNSFYAGFTTQFARLAVIFLFCQYTLDYYQLGHYVPEIWASARYSYPTGIDFDIHEPYTMTYHKGLISFTTEGPKETRVYHPDAKTPINYT
jgi:hypothetical protein